MPRGWARAAPEDQGALDIVQQDWQLGPEAHKPHVVEHIGTRRLRFVCCGTSRAVHLRDVGAHFVDNPRSVLCFQGTRRSDRNSFETEALKRAAGASHTLCISAC